MQSNRSPSRFAALLTIGFLIGVGCSIAAYWLFVNPGNSDQLGNAKLPLAPTEIDPSTQEQSSQTEISTASEEAKTNVLSLDEIAGIKTNFEQQLALRVLLSDMDETQVADLLAQSQDVFEEADRYDLQFAMVQRLSRQNPSQALALILELDTSYNLGHMVATIFGDWGQSDLDGAVARARTLDQNLKISALRAIVQERTDLSDEDIRAIARDLDNEQIATSSIAQRKIAEAINDPEAAWSELAFDLQDDLANSGALSRVATAWLEKSGLGVLDQIYHSLTNSRTRDVVIRHVLVEVAQSDPAYALDYALSIETDPNFNVVHAVVHFWASSDPRAVLSATAQIEDESARKDVAEIAIRTWARNEPREVLEGVSALPADLQGAASTAALREISRKSLEMAAELVAAMEPGSVKTSNAKRIASNWSSRNHSAALDWILNEPRIQEIRTELLSSILSRLVQVDPDLAMTTARSQPIEQSGTGQTVPDSEGIGLELNVISSLVSSDLDKAIELLPQVREGPTKKFAFRLVAQSLVGSDEIDKAFEVALGIPGTDRESFYLALSATWTGIDPVAVLNSMYRFPSEEVRSRAAALLVTTNQFSKALSDAQIEEAKKNLTDEHAKAIEEGDEQALQSIFQVF